MPGLPVVDGLARFELVDAADHLVERAEAELRHDLAQFLAMKRMKLTTCSGLPVNFLRSSGSCVATPTGQVFRWQTRIMMQPSTDQRRGGEAELLGAEQRGDRHVAAGLELAVGLDDDAAAQVVEHQRLVRLGEAELPRQAGVLDRGERRGAGAAVVAADQHHVGVRLGDAGGDGADADLATASR
jgi:hypothetical protein